MGLRQNANICVRSNQLIAKPCGSAHWRMFPPTTPPSFMLPSSVLPHLLPSSFSIPTAPLIMPPSLLCALYCAFFFMYIMEIYNKKDCLIVCFLFLCYLLTDLPSLCLLDFLSTSPAHTSLHRPLSHTHTHIKTKC